MISFGSGGIGEKQIEPIFYIKANDKKTFTLEVTNPGADLSIMYVWPHMHYIGKAFKAYVVSALGDTIKMVHIPDWDFRWQEIYRMKNLVKIPKGSVMHIEGTYDNTAQNPANPNSVLNFWNQTGLLLDFLNIMNYDYHGAWDIGAPAYFQAPYDFRYSIPKIARALWSIR